MPKPPQGVAKPELSTLPIYLLGKHSGRVVEGHKHHKGVLIYTATNFGNLPGWKNLAEILRKV